ncbi:chaplin family protein [Streptomyces sp. NPDC002057]|uniref:chaplin family protein n=1 Tax=Streptomyces sp. NPDC002057 TaxID=3154664 RepID=UPI003325FD4D
MRQIRRSGLATLLVTGGALALSAGAAHADSGAQGAAVGSPGVGSGNTVQLPVHVPVNACGNTVNVVGLLNPAFGNTCENRSAPQEPSGYGSDDGGGRSHKDEPGTPRGGEQAGGSHGGGSQGGSSNGGGSTAEGHAEGSPGVLSGNGLQLPVDLPVNVSGNSVNVVGLLNPVFGNTSVNGPSKPVPPVEKPTPRPQTPVRNVPVPQTETETEKPAPAPAPQGETRPVALAETGSDALGYAASASAALLLGGALLYRRARRAGDQA